LIRKPTFLVLGAAAAALAAAGCGGGGGSTSSAPSTTPAAATSTPASTSGGASSGGSTKLSLSADPSGALKFDKSSLSAKAGTVTITMDNPSSIAHGVAVEGNGVDKDGQIVNKGGKSTVTVTLKPGTYTFYCPVPGHKQAGMKGTLTVQ
jgi:plastocyanin